jgi:hypothetical protein
MVEGEDYGIIPGTQKATLYQPGAQKLTELYNFSHRFETDKEIARWDEPLLFFYQMRCVLTSRHDGRFIAEGLGSCNSREDKYLWRWVNESDIPSGVDKKTLKKRERTTKRGLWIQFRLPNEDITSLVNTVLKMACKRAYVHAVVSATRSAGIFTQDVEDLPRDAFGEEAPTRSWGGSADLAAKVGAAIPPKDDPEVARYLVLLAKIGESGSSEDLDAITPELAERWPEGHRLYDRMSAAWSAARRAVRDRQDAAPEEAGTGPAVATKGKPARKPAQAATPAAKGPSEARLGKVAVTEGLPLEVVQAIARDIDAGDEHAIAAALARDGHTVDVAQVSAVIAALRAA